VNPSTPRTVRPRAPVVFALAGLTGLAAAAVAPPLAGALGEATRLDVRRVDYEGGNDDPRPTAPRRIAWEVRKRTSIETRLLPSSARLDDPSIYATPFLYWTGDAEFPALSSGEVVGLRRFVEFGGFVFADDARPEDGGFARSVRRELLRAFPDRPIVPIENTHTVYRSFYLLDRAVGRVRGPELLQGVTSGDRIAVVLSEHDLGGAYARDNLGSWEHAVSPGGESQRELAIRLGVNLVMYALCLDYKDDQVHAPFILRRRGRTTR
jgi:hypothetical protein